MKLTNNFLRVAVINDNEVLGIVENMPLKLTLSSRSGITQNTFLLLPTCLLKTDRLNRRI